MDARLLLLDFQRWVHSSSVTPSGWEWKMEDAVCAGLADVDLRRCPQDNLNSIAWLLWHMARCEDVAVNTVLRGTQEVLDQGNWLPRLDSATRHIGTEDTHDEVRALSERINLVALRAYRAAVGQETRAWVSSLDLATLAGHLTREDIERARERHAVTERARWVVEYWERDVPRSTFLSWLAVGHSFFHMGEAWVIRGLIESRAG